MSPYGIWNFDKNNLLGIVSSKSEGKRYIKEHKLTASMKVLPMSAIKTLLNRQYVTKPLGVTHDIYDEYKMVEDRLRMDRHSGWECFMLQNYHLTYTRQFGYRYRDGRCIVKGVNSIDRKTWIQESDFDLATGLVTELY